MNAREWHHDVCKEYVLIDTWWNVNMLYANDTSAENSVLIDTWWNVNCYSNNTVYARGTF